MLPQNSSALSSDTDVNYSVVAGFVGSFHVTIVTSFLHHLCLDHDH